MKYEEIIKLLNAGYTKEEIMEMKSEAPAPEEEAPASASEDPAPASAPEEDIIASVNEEIANAISDMRDAFDGFKKEIQAMNIMNSQLDIPETSEDLIGKIINPFPTDDK